ncbi:unnamed protein product [Echinostoma caproni]|uniref:Uncharacterized protein n=1 Tax=Echinostoma caproni TaxID=27848 RepID=A0A183AXE8_9TREM|nr:unnamed protein product [Echinostoma caproni]
MFHVVAAQGYNINLHCLQVTKRESDNFFQYAGPVPTWFVDRGSISLPGLQLWRLGPVLSKPSYATTGHDWPEPNDPTPSSGRGMPTRRHLEAWLGPHPASKASQAASAEEALLTTFSWRRCFASRNLKGDIFGGNIFCPVWAIDVQMDHQLAKSDNIPPHIYGDYCLTASVLITAFASVS